MTETVASDKHIPEKIARRPVGWIERGRVNAVSWRGEFVRVALIIGITAIFALGTNFLHYRPVPLLTSDGPGAWPDTADRITVTELKDLLQGTKKIFLLDVRTQRLFQASHPVGAINAPAHDFMEYCATVAPYLDVADMIVVICNSKDCPLGDRVAHILIEDLKHERVRVLDGGWEAYLQAGLSKEGTD